jgi:hypothetical protein
MNDQECDEVYEFLLAALTKSGLEWVSDQVVDQVHLGKTVEIEVETLREIRPAESLFTSFGPDQNLFHLRKGPRATFPITIEYRPKERVLLLIDAINQAIVNTAEMESILTEYFDSEVGHEMTVEFDSDEADSARAVVSHQGASLRIATSQKLKGLLEELRNEI